MRARDFPHSEGLKDEVVSPQLEADNLVDLLRLRADENDRHAGVGPADLLANLIAVNARHHNVEADEVRRLAAKQGERLGSVFRDHGLVTFVREDFLQPGADIPIVFGNQHFHSSITGCRGRTRERYSEARPYFGRVQLQIAAVKPG